MVNYLAGLGQVLQVNCKLLRVCMETIVLPRDIQALFMPIF